MTNANENKVNPVSAQHVALPGESNVEVRNRAIEIFDAAAERHDPISFQQALGRARRELAGR